MSRAAHAKTNRFASPSTWLDSTLAVLRRRVWLIAAIVPFVVYWVAEYGRYLTLPDALYGGDMWQQFGITLHMWQGHAPWEDSYFAGEWAFRDWLMYAIVAGVSRATFIDPLTVAILWPIVPLVGGGICLYALGKRMFAHEGVALAMSIAWMGFSPYMAYQSSSFAAMLTVPLFLLALVSQDGSLKRRVLLGLAYGAAALSYIVAFFGCTMILGVVFLWRAARRPFAASLVAQLKAFWPVAAVGAPIVLALWAPLLLVYHGDVQNPAHIYGEAGRGWNAAQAWGFLADHFLDWRHPFMLGLGLLAAFGLFAAWKQRDSHGGKWALLVFGVGMVGVYHYLVTWPLFENHLVFFRWSKVFLALARVLLAAQAIVFLTRDAHNDELSVKPMAFALGSIILGAAIMTPSARSEFHENSPVDDAWARAMLDTSVWVRDEIPKDAVFLTLDQEGFAFNGLTGKDLVIGRRTHANTFVDMDRRIADAAVMIYGKDRAFARQLMDDYGVTHAYVGWFWEMNERDHPLMTNPKYAEYWAANGIQFTRDVAPYDPAGDGQMFDVIMLDAPQGEWGQADELPFLQDFRIVKDVDVEGDHWMHVYERAS